ncbi:class I SAM-dependent methyltransferase [Chloroflexota bacterium]
MFILNYSTVIDPLLRNIRVYTAEFSGIKTGEKILDIGCGTGDQVFHYARKDITATGIDKNPYMLRLAERNMRKRGLSNVSFQIADALNLPFPDNSFDHASISFALHENNSFARDKIVAEMKRVVKGGGNLILLDFRVPLPKGFYRYFIHAIEFIVGSNNYRCFKDYIQQGGLDGILKKNQLPRGNRDNMNNRILTIVKTTNV